MSVERGGVEGGLGKILTFSYQLFSEKFVFLISSGKKFHHFWPPREKFFALLGKLLLPALDNIFRPSCTQRLINHGQLVKQCFDQVRLKADTICSVRSVVDLH